jgi:hypothetical protein
MPVTPVPINDPNSVTIYPAITVDEVATNYISQVVNLVTTATRLDIDIDGSFLLRSKMLTLPSAAVADRTVVLRWPAFWFDVYVLAAPDEGIDGYDVRSNIISPVEHLAVMEPADGMLGFYSPTSDLWPHQTQPFTLTVPTLTLTTTDVAVLAALSGIGTATIYIKPRMDPVVQAINGGDFAVPDNTLILTETYEGFLGNAVITITG